MENIIKETIAFDNKGKEIKGYRIIGTYLTEPKGGSLIEIFKNEILVKEFLFPSYKIWNIPAHAEDIITGLEQESDVGLRIAGSTGLGGNVYNG